MRINFQDQLVYRPLIFKTGIKNEHLDLLLSDQSVQKFDTLEDQIQELIKSIHPSEKLQGLELETKCTEFLKSKQTFGEYGVWVYYPWRNYLVKTLEKNEFILLRTNRNCYKITPEEQTLLSQKCIGIIGLSVGGAIARTVAMERICGKLKLADFDKIELSNLNRIETGIFNIQLPKTIVTARTIAEFDPFLEIECFSEGLNDDNLNSFLAHDKLDLLMEECDGLVMKIKSRVAAKAHEIPVVMISSDKNTLDVERFDLDKNLPILHGFIDHMDLSEVDKAQSNEEKIPFLMPILGLETTSKRLNASMLEIGETISTWPQLASAVISGAGIITDVSRRILINEFTDSGRYFIDIEELVSSNNNLNPGLKAPKPFVSSEISLDFKPLHTAHQNAYVSPAIEALKTMVSAAILAPSAGNNQPWKWTWSNDTLLLFLDEERKSGTLDNDCSASLMGIGAALENLTLKASELGFRTHITGQNFPLKIYFSLCENPSPFTYLAQNIDKRCTNRIPGMKSRINPDALASFNQLTVNDKFALSIFTDEKITRSLSDIIRCGDRLFFTCEAYHQDFMKEVRWTKTEAINSKDGLDLELFHFTTSEKLGLQVAKNWKTVEYLQKWGKGNIFEKISDKTLKGASALGLLTMKPNQDYIEAGRIMERIWLNATHHNLGLQPQTPITFLLHQVRNNQTDQMHPKMLQELIEINKKLKEIIHNPNHIPVFLFRLTLADQPIKKSLRRPLHDVFTFDYHESNTF